METTRKTIYFPVQKLGENVGLHAVPITLLLILAMLSGSILLHDQQGLYFSSNRFFYYLSTHLSSSSASPDIKNSTIIPVTGARNIKDFPDALCSPIGQFALLCDVASYYIKAVDLSCLSGMSKSQVYADETMNSVSDGSPPYRRGTFTTKQLGNLFLVSAIEEESNESIEQSRCCSVKQMLP